jgi:hypothetical protein
MNHDRKLAQYQLPRSLQPCPLYLEFLTNSTLETLIIEQPVSGAMGATQMATCPTGGHITSTAFYIGPVLNQRFLTQIKDIQVTNPTLSNPSQIRLLLDQITCHVSLI